MLAPKLAPQDELKYKLLGSFLDFTRYFYKIRTGRKFELSQPTSRESHYVTVSKALTQCHRGEIPNLGINIPPRYGKTELLIHFVAWCLARNAACNFIYVSYSHTLATKQTATVREIVSMPEYRRLFGVDLADDTQAKDNFATTAGGSVYAVGAGGSITGRGAGIANLKDFGGAIIIDDIIKPQDALSDTIRDSRNDWYKNTLLSRLNNRNTPIIFIGQRVHEDDLAGNLQLDFDGRNWQWLILQALDHLNHALMPTLHTTEELQMMAKKMPYEFASQYQQNPQKPGGSVYQREWFVLLDIIPSMLITFITCDTAETDKTYNDATVFSFWGLYKITQHGIDSDLYGLHCIDCNEMRVQPKDLQSEFLAFFAECSRFPVKPKQAYIEKKSTGTTMFSVLQSMRALAIIAIERDGTSKTARFLQAQPFVAAHQVSITRGARHEKLVLDHMEKITANNTHRHDDIADTMADAISLAFIDKTILGFVAPSEQVTYQSVYRHKKPINFGGFE